MTVSVTLVGGTAVQQGGVVPLPEGVPLTFFTPVQGAEMAHGVGPVLAPAHPGQLQTLAHDRLAGALDRPTPNAPAPRQVLGILHAMGVALQVGPNPTFVSWTAK